MNPEIEQLEDILDSILLAVRQAIQSGEPLPEQVQQAVAQEITALTEEIESLYQNEQVPQPEPTEPLGGLREPNEVGIGPPPSADAQLLFILAGQQEDAFLNYLQQYPSPSTQQLLNNPSELERTLRYLHAMMPSSTPPTVDGIQHSYLNSSTIWGTSYNPANHKMKVRFQGGAEYEYDDVPTNIYRAFSNGQASAKTNGSNQYGAWFVNKNPSMGAAMNQYIKNGGFAYRRLR